MQTFLPYRSFERSAGVLDRARLGKQRVEVLQILNALSGKSKGWVNHSCTRMWKGYEESLIRYGMCICEEWKMRGYKDTCLDKIKEFRKIYTDTLSFHILPDWMDDNPALHLSHQSNLLRKNKEYYSKFFPSDVPDNLPYVWPV